MAVQRSLTITEDTDLPLALSSLKEACRNKGVPADDLERVMATASAAANECAERGRRLLSHGSSFHATQVISEPPVTLQLTCDFVAGKRSLLNRVRKRLRG